MDRFSTLRKMKANGWFGPTEREKWASPAASSNTETHLGLPALHTRARELYEKRYRAVCWRRASRRIGSRSTTECRQRTSTTASQTLFEISPLP